jgi:hypothetical protein
LSASRNEILHSVIFPSANGINRLGDDDDATIILTVESNASKMGILNQNLVINNFSEDFTFLKLT